MARRRSSEFDTTVPTNYAPLQLLGIAEQPWMAEALCAQVDSEIFFPEKGGSTKDAKDICRRCPVSAECLDYALANNEHFGIWGGTSERERRTLGGHTALRTCPECQAEFEVPTGANSVTYCGGECRRAARRRSTPEQRRYQLIYQRARGGAVARLIKAHQDEYEQLLTAEKEHATREADALDLTAKQKGEQHADEPARLKSGRKATGQTVLDRIDVARCPHCVKHHDRGHRCTVCGATPGTQPPQQPRRLPAPRRTTTVDPAALAEFNEGTQRARKAARR